MAFGENLRRIRTSRGMTQNTLSELTGIKLGQISKIERNDADTKLSTIYKLLEALDCSADTLFLDEAKTGVKGMLKEAFENASKLPKEEQITIVKVIDRFVDANGIDKMLKESRVLLNWKKRGIEKRHIPEENEE